MDPWPNTKLIVYIRGDYQDLKAKMADNGFSETRDFYSPGGASNFMVKYWTDKNGNLYCDIASEMPADKWTKRQILEMMLFAPINIIEREDQVIPGPDNLLSEFVQAWGLNSTYPYFTFGPSQ